MILGLIPARGQSRRLPRKNVRLIRGRPLIGWTILEALKTAGLSGVTVSTDNDEIAEVAREYGAAIIKRPHYLATDQSLVYGTINHAVERRNLDPSDSICLLQVTSPLTLAEDIDRCIDEHLRTGKPTMTVALGQSVANGSVYCGTVDWLRNGGSWDDGSPSWVQMPPARSVDINTLEDFETAERMMAGSAKI